MGTSSERGGWKEGAESKRRNAETRRQIELKRGDGRDKENQQEEMSWRGRDEHQIKRRQNPAQDRISLHKWPPYNS